RGRHLREPQHAARAARGRPDRGAVPGPQGRRLRRRHRHPGLRPGGPDDGRRRGGSDRSEDASVVDVVGYSDPWSVATGEEVQVMVSTRSARFRASFPRLAGAGGAGPVPSAIDGERPGREQPLRAGSHAVVDDPPPLGETDFTLEAWIWPTAPG